MHRACERFRESAVSCCCAVPANQPEKGQGYFTVSIAASVRVAGREGPVGVKS